MSDQVRSPSPGPLDPGDPVGGLLAKLRGQHPPAPFAPAAAVRARGRLRRRRQLAAAGAAVLVVIALGAASLSAVVAEPAPPAAPPPASPAPTTPEDVPAQIPPAWVLATDEIGPGWAVVDGHELFEGDPPWLFAGFCEDFNIAEAPSLEARRDLLVASWRRQAASASGRVDQVVELFDDSPAAIANLADIRAVAGGCQQVPTPGAGAGVAQLRLEITEDGFAGDESLLIRSRMDQPGGDPAAAAAARPMAVVRVGAVVTTLVYDFGATSVDIHELARQAAARLR